MKQKILLVAISLMMTLGIKAQDMKGHIYYNGNMDVTHLLKQKEDEDPDKRAKKEAVFSEIFTMSITMEFPTSDKMKCKPKIMMDEERAKELSVNMLTRKKWQAQLTLAAKQRHDWYSKYKVKDGIIEIEDGTTFKVSDNGEELYVNDDTMEATLKRIK